MIIMNTLDILTDVIEERIVKGDFRWLANFKEIKRNFKLENLNIPLYAEGGLQEKGFFLSRIFSALVTPRYKVHFIFYTTQQTEGKFLRNLILTCKRNFGSDNWIFLGIAQEKPIEKAVKNLIENLADTEVGIVAYSLSSNKEVFSKNVLGKGLKKHLRLSKSTFEAFDIIDYLKSFLIAIVSGTLLLVVLQILFSIPVFNPLVAPLIVVLLLLFSIIAGHSIYKSQYHIEFSLNTEGFEIKKGGKSVKRGKWKNFKDVTIYLTPKRETCIRLYSEKETVDIPISRVGVSRKEAYNFIKQLIGKK